MLSPFGVVAALCKFLFTPAGSSLLTPDDSFLFTPAGSSLLTPNDSFLYIPAGSSGMGDWFMITYDLLVGGWCFYPLSQVRDLRLGKTHEGHMERK